MIYFVRNPQTGLIKIGVTINLQTRMLQLRSAYRDLELLGIMGGSFEEKTRLHERFARQRIRRTDWFRVCDELLAYIDTYTHLNIPSESAFAPSIDTPISVSLEVRALLDVYIANLQACENRDDIGYSEAIFKLFETHLPQYCQQVQQMPKLS